MVHSASLALVHSLDTQDGDNEAAAKSYSEPICASVNTEWCACSYDLQGKLSFLLIIHETSYITISTNEASQKGQNGRRNLQKENEQQS